MCMDRLSSEPLPRFLIVDGNGLKLGISDEFSFRVTSLSLQPLRQESLRGTRVTLPREAVLSSPAEAPTPHRQS